MSVPKPKDIRRNTIPSSWPNKHISDLFQFLAKFLRQFAWTDIIVCIFNFFGNLLSEEEINCVVRKRVWDATHYLDVCQIRAICIHFKETLFKVCSNNFIDWHSKIKLVLKPDSVHNSKDLKREDVLPQVISIFENSLVDGLSCHVVNASNEERGFGRTEDFKFVVGEVLENILRVANCCEKKR